MERKIVTPEDVIRRLCIEGNQKWYDWVRQMLTLSSSGLVLLVSLQANYLPKQPIAIWLIQTSWGSLAATIASAAIILFGEHASHFESAREMQRALNTQGFPAAAQLAQGTYQPKRIYVIATRALPCFLTIAMLSLTIFALLNVG